MIITVQGIALIGIAGSGVGEAAGVGLGAGGGDGDGAGAGAGAGAGTDAAALRDQMAGSLTHHGPPYQSVPVTITD